LIIDVVNPRTGEVDTWTVAASREEVLCAASLLRAAQPVWRARGPEQRAKVLLRCAEAIEARAAHLVDRLSVDTGRLAIARMEVFAVFAMMRRWAGCGPGIIASLDRVDVASTTPGVVIANRHVPYQLFGAITPWNFPLLLGLVDAIPALMAGCAALIKPSEITPRFVPILREAIADVPELADVLCIVEGGAETGQAVVEAVDYICFTGSVATGRKVAEAAARAFIPANLELGGKDPMIVLASADPQKAAKIALRASVLASGQACQSIERVYVHRALADIFLAALVAEAKAVELNYPDIASGHIGPFIFPPQALKVQAQIDEALSMGATLHCGGSVETLGGGKYLRPTVLTNVTRDMAIIRDETFGPVIPVTVFDDVEDAIAQANDSVYGLSAAVIGDPSEAERIGKRLEAGAISINDGSLTAFVSDAPNEAFKLSGLGPSRMGDPGLTRFFRTQAIIRQNGVPAAIADFAEEKGV
jgi:succinate-semialdehyde dehydrogenase / glutarate-semialdehyde dehydrogenase